MEKLFKKLKYAFSSCEANRYDAIVESNVLPLDERVIIMHSLAAGKTKNGWQVFEYEYAPVQACEPVVSVCKIEDKIYKIDNINYRRFVRKKGTKLINKSSEILSYDQAVQKLKSFENQEHTKGPRLKEFSVEPDRHYSRFQTPRDVPKRRQKIRRWKL